MSDFDDSSSTQTSKNSNTSRIIQLEKDNKILKADNANLKLEMEKLLKAFTNLEQMVKKSSTQAINNTGASPQPLLFSSIVSGKTARVAPTQNEINVLNAYTTERNDMELRERNVLIMGDTNTTDDLAKKTVEEIFTAINIDIKKIKTVYRFKQSANNTHPPIIKVCLANKDDRLEVLKASKNLRNKPMFAKIYINPDLTFAQRNLEKKLIAERKKLNDQRLTSQNEDDKKFYYGIRNGVIKRIPCAPVQ